MPQLNQKGVIQLAVVFLLITGIAATVYLVNRAEPLKWFPQAFEIQSTSGLEIGLEAGEQHDTSRVGLISESGAAWVRLNFVGTDWSIGSSDVNTYNTIINAYRSRNIKIIGLIGAQSVAGGYDRNNPDAFTQKFVDAADAIIARFGDRVKAYELFNEPNDWAGGNTAQVTPRYFAQYLGRIYRQIKITKGRNDISLNSGPLLSHDLANGADYLESTYTEGRGLSDQLGNWTIIKSAIGSYPLDGVGYHIYVAQGMGDQALVESKIRGNLDAIKNVINSQDPGKKIWITEFGWGTGTGRVTEDVQALNLNKAYQVFKSDSSVKMAMWFTLMDFDTAEWGLVRGDGRKKLAWNTFQKVNIQPTPTSGSACIQVVTPAKNSATGECREFPTPCDVPAGWQKVTQCGSTPAPRPSPTPVPLSCTACNADLNKDGVVNNSDAARMTNCVTGKAKGSACLNMDFNGNGKVDQEDLKCVRSVYNQKCTKPKPTPTPRPTEMSIF